MEQTQVRARVIEIPEKCEHCPHLPLCTLRNLIVNVKQMLDEAVGETEPAQPQSRVAH